MLPITEMLLRNHNRPKKKLIQLKGIVIHYTGNTSHGANAAANRNFFNCTSSSVSAHYIVDDKQIIQCIPDDEVAWHVGAKKYVVLGEILRVKPYSPNYYTIGIEMCVNSDSDWSKTYANTVDLVKHLLQKHKLTVDNLYRHYDITGKECPKMMVPGGEWEKFKASVLNALQRVEIMFKGKYLAIPLKIEQGVSYAPVRALCEGMGYTVVWDNDNKRIIID